MHTQFSGRGGARGLESGVRGFSRWWCGWTVLEVMGEIVCPCCVQAKTPSEGHVRDSRRRARPAAGGWLVAPPVSIHDVGLAGYRRGHFSLGAGPACLNSTPVPQKHPCLRNTRAPETPVHPLKTKPYTAKSRAHGTTAPLRPRPLLRYQVLQPPSPGQGVLRVHRRSREVWHYAGKQPSLASTARNEQSRRGHAKTETFESAAAARPLFPSRSLFLCCLGR